MAARKERHITGEVSTVDGLLSLVQAAFDDLPHVRVLCRQTGRSAMVKATEEQLTAFRDLLSERVYNPEENAHVARHERMLTKRQAEVLAEHPYDAPAGCTRAWELVTCRQLVKLGLLEKAPDARLWRATAAGMDLLTSLRQKGWLPWPQR